MPRSSMPLLAAAMLLPCGAALAHPGSHGEDLDLGPETVPSDMVVHLARVNGVEHKVRITEKDGYRIITANGIPDHEPGRFPSRGNPNAISAQDYEYRVPLEPEKATRESASRGRVLFGVAINGVPFDPGTAEIWTPDGRTRGRDAPRNGYRYEALTGNINLGLDDHNAHVQPTGAYHYHALPVGVYESVAGKPVAEVPDQMVLIGYAADGFPIYGVWAHEDPTDPDSPLVRPTTSWRVKAGNRPAKSDISPGGAHDGTFVQDWEYVEDAGDLDEHHGQFGITPEYPDGIYYYMITDEYPFIPRTFYGTPDRSFSPARGGGEGQGRGERGERRRGERGGEDGERSRRPPPR
ncbi:MAG: YHYH protein [Planctomycetota bacterium]